MAWHGQSDGDRWEVSELVDIVDNFDEVIGSVERTEAHARGLSHRIVAVLLVNEHGRMVVQTRKDNGQADHGAGGHVRAGEEYRAAAWRELAEELGVRTELSLLGCTTVEETSGVRHRMAVFTGVVELEWEFVPTDEVELIEWWEPELIVERMSRDPGWAANGFKASMAMWTAGQGLAG